MRRVQHICEEHESHDEMLLLSIYPIAFVQLVSQERLLHQRLLVAQLYPVSAISLSDAPLHMPQS